MALHVVSGGGWFGAAFCMLLISWTNQDPTQHYAVNLVMERMDEFVMIPVPLVAIATGLLLSWGTLWGLFRWYWVLVKQVATYALLLLAPFTVHEWIVQMTNLAQDGAAGGSYTDVQRLHVLASVVIVVTGAAIVTISVLKPWGRRKQPLRQPSGDAEHGSAASFTRAAVQPGTIGESRSLGRGPTEAESHGGQEGSGASLSSQAIEPRLQSVGDFE